MTERFETGDIVLVEVPFSDLSGTKKRPALVLLTSEDDPLVAYITSQLHQAGPRDVLRTPTPANGLIVDSAVLVQKLFAVHSSLITRKLGHCADDTYQAVVNELTTRLEQTLPAATTRSDLAGCSPHRFRLT